MAFLYKKNQNGNAYYYIRETARVKGKVKVVFQEYLGTIDAILKLKKDSDENNKTLKTLCYDFGSIWMFNEIDKIIDIAQLIDTEIPQSHNEKGPTIGEYFYYTILNRCIEPKSKNSLNDWYDKTAIQYIRPVNTSDLTSKRYWDKWDRIDDNLLNKITDSFLSKIHNEINEYSDCILFDTSNYYTYFNNTNESNLAKRGKNKDGKSNLRQIGFALVIDRESALPLYFKLYEGNKHDSKLFNEIIADILDRLNFDNKSGKKLTIVFDKGMNSENNIKYLDSRKNLHFISSYSTFYSSDIIKKDIKKFKILNIPKNVKYSKEQKEEEEQILYYRTKKKLWGKTRTLLITYTPATFRKKHYAFNEKMEKLKNLLSDYCKKVNSSDKKWQKEADIIKRYEKECENLHISKSLFSLNFKKMPQGLTMEFKEDKTEIDSYVNRFGKNIIVTDNINWSSEEIYITYMERNKLEQQFRQSKSDHQVNIIPSYHWTDSKIKIFYFTCVVAMSYLRLLEIKLEKAGIKITAQAANDVMKTLHMAFIWRKGKKNPERVIEEPNSKQLKIINAFEYIYNPKKCALQKIK